MIINVTIRGVKKKKKLCTQKLLPIVLDTVKRAPVIGEAIRNIMRIVQAVFEIFTGVVLLFFYTFYIVCIFTILMLSYTCVLFLR